jgi:hypothetical protein
MSLTKCTNCKSNVISGIMYNSNIYCSEKCYCIIKKCDYCSNEFNINECNGIAHNPYWFCSSTHYELSTPRIKYGVIGGPVGGPRGKPRGCPIGQIKKPNTTGQTQPIINCPVPPQSMRRAITPPPGLMPQQSMRRAITPPPILMPPSPGFMPPPPGLMPPPPGLMPPPMIYSAPSSPVPIYMGVPFNFMQQYFMRPLYFNPWN